MNKKPFAAAWLAAFLSVSGAAIAHGDEDHARQGSAATHAGHAAALGQPGDANKVDRTITLTMSDGMRFSPASVSVKQGETIRFVLKNEGRLKHEMVLGTIAELKEHAALMVKFPGMQHADPNQASVEPGQTAELIWRFTKTGTFDFACLQPGHFEAGMKGQVRVAGAATPSQVDSLATEAALAPAAAGDLTDGEVRKVDREAGKVTLKHGEIRNLDMPGMTMVFAVRDKALLDRLKVGDQVKFKAVADGGKLTITQIEMMQ